MTSSSARTLKSPRRLQHRRDRRSPSPHWQFLRGFIKNPVMVGSIIPSSRVLIDKMLDPVDWANTKLFVEYGPGVGTFTRPILERLGGDAKLVTIDTNPDFTKYLKERIDVGGRTGDRDQPITSCPASPFRPFRRASATPLLRLLPR